MLAHPQLYLNGTAPLNITGAVRSCIFQEGADTSDESAADCTIATGTDVDSFLWSVRPLCGAEVHVTKFRVSAQVRRAAPI